MYLMWEEKKKRKEKESNALGLVIRKKGGKSRGMHEIHTYETHLRNSKWIVI